MKANQWPPLIIARLTLLEAVRRKIVLAAFILGFAFLVLFGIGLYFALRDVAPVNLNSPALNRLFRSGMSGGMTILGLYAVNFLSIVMATLTTADTLAGEINSGTIQAVVSKPLRRAEIVLGKWLGLAALMALYLLLMAGGVILVASLLAHGLTVQSLLPGLGLLYLEVLLIMTITLACSSVISTLATGAVALGLFGLAFIGGWVEQFGSLVHSQTAINVGIVSSLIMPSEALWHRASYEMTPPLLRTMNQSMTGPFITTSVPSLLMVAYGVFYLIAAFAFAVRRFSRRDL